ncbi:MAG TPA: hypothetical protein PLB10_01150 [Thiolinea sp.]|nr:hypothetical protein [Thiolinea sp.]
MKISACLLALAPLVLAVSLHAAEWTSSFSEEGQASQTCANGSALRGIQCSGRYCDNLSLYCGDRIGNTRNSWWARYISEENRNGRDTVNGVVVRVNDNMQRCSTNGYITGMRCNGDYCDNISLLCTQFSNRSPGNCSWSPWISEENGGRLVFAQNRHAVAMECRGGYCDNKRFLICN